MRAIGVRASGRLAVGVAAIVVAGVAAAAAGASLAASSTAALHAVGHGDGALWTVRGRTLTVTFAHPRRFLAGPWHVRCGDADPPADTEEDGWTGPALWADYVDGVTHAGRSVARLAATFPAPLPSELTYCEADAPGQIVLRSPLMRLSGPPVVCTKERHEQLVAADSQVLVTQLFWSDGVTGAQADLRACLLPSGPKMLIVSTSGTLAGGDSYGDVLLDGRWIAWTGYDSGPDIPGDAYLSRVELRSTGANPTVVQVPDAIGPDLGTGPEDVVLGANGALAWTGDVSTYPPGTPQPEPAGEWLFAAAVGRSALVIASAGSLSMSDIALTSDATAVTWRQGGVSHTAPIPGLPTPGS